MSEQASVTANEGQEQHHTEDQPIPDAPALSTEPSRDGEQPGDGPSTDGQQPPAMSKNALKRLRKRQEWEDGREDRAKRRKEKRHERKERWREARDAAAAGAATQDPADGTSTAVASLPPQPTSHRPKPSQQTLVPIALVVDCDFESYMSDKELISIANQVVRCYADNRGARYRSHLWISGWRGKIRERFETTLRGSHRGWKGTGFCEGDFIVACAEATQKMIGAPASASASDAASGAGAGGTAAVGTGGEMIGPLQRSRDNPVAWTRDEKDPFPLPDPETEPAEEHKNIVYLTSESPYTLDRLEPNTCYVVGGIVDKNREKGLCYRRARERGIRTARLPIGRFMVMQSRQVLATNHVVEIMLKWLEYEDWGKAFTAVIPKRKGGTLRADSAGGDEAAEAEEEDGNGEEVEGAEGVDTAERVDESDAQTGGIAVEGDSNLGGKELSEEK